MSGYAYFFAVHPPNRLSTYHNRKADAREGVGFLHGDVRFV